MFSNQLLNAQQGAAPGGIFPALSVADYALWDARDAGATWAPRHASGWGVGKVMTREGSVPHGTLGGHETIITGSGCYWLDKTGALQASTAPYALWVLAKDKTSYTLYPTVAHAPKINSGNASSNVYWRTYSTRMNSGNRSVYFTNVRDDTLKSMLWQFGTAANLSSTEAYVDNVGPIPYVFLDDRSVSLGSDTLVVGGNTTNPEGFVYAPCEIAKVLWVHEAKLTEADRNALDDWWRAAG